MQRELAQANLYDVRIVHRADPLLREQRHCARAGLTLLENLNGPAPGFLLTVVDLAQIESVALDNPTTRCAPVFDQAVVAVLLAVFLSRRVAQKHNGIRLCTSARLWE